MKNDNGENRCACHAKPKHVIGMAELVKWVKLQEGNVEDKSKKANEELKNKGLL